MPHFANEAPKWTKYSYDFAGRKTSETFDNSLTTTFIYNGLTTTTTSPSGQSSTQTYNAAADPVSATDAGGTIVYDYYAPGFASQITAPENATTSITYDDFGRQTSITDPNAGTIAYTYNPLDQILTQTDARDSTTTNTYDAHGRIAATQAGSRLTTYYYVSSGINKGQLDSVTCNNGTAKVYTYDAFGRITQLNETSGSKTFSTKYTYGSDGQLDSYTYPSGYKLLYAYDSNGFQHQIRDSANVLIWQLNAVNAMGQELASTVLGRSKTQIFNNLGQPTQMTLQNLMAYTYQYNANTGNLNKRVNSYNGQNEIFVYDNLDRVMGEGSTLNNVQSVRGTNYHPNGNISSKTGIGNYHYHKVKKHAVVGVDYVDEHSSARTISYNSFERVNTIDNWDQNSQHTKMTFVYGPTRQRQLATLITPYLTLLRYYATNSEYAENPPLSTNAIANAHRKEYIYSPYGLIAIRNQKIVRSGSGILSDTSAVNPVATDHLGSIVAEYNFCKGKYEFFGYDAWGRRYRCTTTTTGGSISTRPTTSHKLFYFDQKPPALYDVDELLEYFTRGYTGHEHLDMFGLINMNGRFYDPMIGRMLSPDPYVQAPTSTQSYNRYSYVLNNPLKYTDPSGELFGISFTKWGYELDKFLFHFAIKIDLHGGNDSEGKGYDISWGIPKMIPISYRQHNGETNYTQYYDNSFSGTEHREGAEWTLGLLFNFSGTKFTSGEISQTTNKITIGTDIGLHISYENDYMFNWSMPGVPKADGGDRWRTAAVEIGGAFLKLNLNMFTGDPGLKQEDRIYKMIDGRNTYISGTADKYRAGVLSLSIGPLRIGRNSEQIRKVFQNQFAHDMLTKKDGIPKAKWFRVLNRKPRWYWYFGTGTGNTLW